jgi:LuxR family transcriptional regulator, maltose regulon positive regulatory protein
MLTGAIEQVGARAVVPRPRLHELLDAGAARALTLVSAPAGSGKTMLVRAWLRERAVPGAGAIAWAAIDNDDWDATDFWREIARALRAAGIATDHGLRDELHALPASLTLVIDDAHHLTSPEAGDALRRLLAGALGGPRIALLTRKDPSLGLHRLRLSGDLAEIRALDLRFTQGEADALLRAAGVTLSDAAVGELRERTEGWAAGLRLAAMFLARSDDPETAVAEFSGTERTVAEYLIGEVLAHQSEEVRDLLLRTCILDRVTGPLADALTGRDDGERLLLELEDANAFVTAVDSERSWFRYHQLLVDLLRVELRRQLPSGARRLHRRAARWLADHGHIADAMRQAVRGEDYALAASLLADHWPTMLTDGEAGTLSALLRGLPAKLAETDADLSVTFAADRLHSGQWEEADAHLARAAELAGTVRTRRRASFAMRHTLVKLLRSAHLGPRPGELDRAEGALARAGSDLRALGLAWLGVGELWAGRLDDAARHLDEASEVAELAELPLVALFALGHRALVDARLGALREAERRALKAVDAAQRGGWLTHPGLGAAYTALAAVSTESLSAEDAETWLNRAELVVHESPQPALEVMLGAVRGQLALAARRDAEAAERFAAARAQCERLCGGHHLLSGPLAAWHARALLHLGDRAAVRALAADTPESRLVHARALLGEGDPGAALAALGPPPAPAEVAVEAGLVEAVARDRLGQRDAAVGAVERALELAEPDGRVRAVADGRDAVRDLLERHPRHATRHGAFIGELLDQLDGRAPRRGPEPETLSDRELRVLRYLPTNLTIREIAGELIVSTNTVKTHVRSVYAKLHVHGRSEAVERAREAGLLSPERR